ncbi:MAG: hypothetical protein J1F67_12725, partial [Muribaculaceae bacterium]|nr:hypothetical protein [Muribaculaceae bacterium]
RAIGSKRHHPQPQFSGSATEERWIPRPDTHSSIFAMLISTNGYRYSVAPPLGWGMGIGGLGMIGMKYKVLG